MRFALVGLGWAARGFHLPALRRVPGAVVVGGCDSSAEQRASFSRDTGIETFEDLDSLVDRTSPDVVLIATPPDSHTALCLRALERGTHVICEKPFVPTVREATEVLEAAAAAEKQVAVNHEFREKPIFKALEAAIGSPEAGRLVFCQVWQLMNLAPWDEPVAWRAAMPNRTLFEGGIHLVDLLLTLWGETPQAVYARHSAGLASDRDADAVHLVLLEFSEGRLAQITIDRLCKAGTHYVEVRADCEQASLRASLGGRALLRLGKKRAEAAGLHLEFATGGLAWMERGLKRRTLARNPRQAGMRATGELLRKIAEALAAGREPPSSGREAREALRVVEAAYESAETGRRVELEAVPAVAED